MNRTKIEWTDYTWNPAIGCLHGCSYCYAKRMNDRFKWTPDWKQIRYFPERLQQPCQVKKPGKIFVGSMTDLFGDWVPSRWIDKVLKVVSENPHHTFQFLTKNPKRYLEFDFPENCRLGMTADRPLPDEIKILRQKPNYRYVSCEPLLGSMEGMDFSGVDLVLVGAMTGIGAIKPKKEWIESIRHPNIFYKNNIKPFLSSFGFEDY